MQYIEKELKFHKKHRGALNKDKEIYLIKLGRKELGFFATYRQLLELLHLANMSGMFPVVQFSDEFAYAEKKPVNGTINPFEYYFCQPSGISLLQAKNSFNVIDSDSLHSTMVQLVLNGKCKTYDTSNLYLRQLARAQRKYIKLNPTTEKYVQHGIDSVIGNKKVLGVHVRGSDFKKNYHNHPLYISEMEYISEVEKKLAAEKWDRVFLATDDLKTIDKFKEKFGDKLVYYSDVVRTNSEKSVVFSENARELHHYRLGLEVIRDVYTLASCEGLVAGVSQVSTCARIVKLSYGRDYSFLKIISKGINHNNRQFVLYKTRDKRNKNPMIDVIANTFAMIKKKNN